MTSLFWLMSGLLFYVYAGYPLFLWAIRLLGGARPVRLGNVEPEVTLVISAFNEADVIAEKLHNSIALDYPRRKLQVIVVSDASDDGTDDLVVQFAPQGVELLRMAARGGKTVGLNAAVQAARGEIIVFSDANALYGRDVLRMIVRNFADPQVGAVVGESTYVDPEVESERSEGLYWKYETWIKRLESAIGSVVGGDGAIYAVRRSLYEPMQPDALSDFVDPLQVVRAGYRCLYEPAARSYEKAADSFNKEFRRKVRIVNRAWRAAMRLKALLNPFRHGFFAIELVSHKLLRWLVPAFMAILLLANLVLATHGGIYALALLLQVLFYALAMGGYLMRGARHIPAPLSIPYYFCLVNVASARGIIDVMRGETYTTWTTSRTPGT